MSRGVAREEHAAGAKRGFGKSQVRKRIRY